MTLNDILKSYSDFTDRFWETACFNEKKEKEKKNPFSFFSKALNLKC